jgi:hypothetical protein
MDVNQTPPELSQALEVSWTHRWEIYHRLQDLHIPCQCGSHQPLYVSLQSPIAAIQLWSVVKQITASRSELVHWLDKCWRLESGQ